MAEHKFESQILEILDVLQRIGAEDFSKRLPVYDQNELLDALSTGVNMVSEELEFAHTERKKNVILLEELVEKLESSGNLLLEEKDKYQTLTENITVGIFRSKGEANQFIEVNSAMATIFGFKSRVELLMTNPEDHYKYPNDRIRFLSELAKIGSVKNEEIEYIKKDGTTITCSVSANAIFLRSGEMEYFDGVIEDITEQKRLQSEIEQREEFLNSITTSAQDGIIVIDPDGNVIFWNNSAEAIFGYSTEEITGRNFHDIIVPAKYHDSFRKGFEAFKKTGTGEAIGQTLELTAFKKGVIEIPVELSLSAVMINNQWHGVGIVRDISERKDNERILNEATAEIEKINFDLKKTIESKDKFFSIIAHDLKGPFNTLIGFSDLAMKEFDSRDPEEIKDMIKHIHNSSLHGFNLLNNLLEWSRSQTGRIHYEPIDFNLTDLIRENVLMISDAAYKKNIEVQNELKEQIITNADRMMINTVVRNLISNALKFTESGGEISIAAKKGDGELIVSVTDSGVGINKENISKLFNLTESQSTPGTSDEKGTGLGLILCKEFVEKNGGKIRVESKKDKGSQFSFSLPQKDS